MNASERELVERICTAAEHVVNAHIRSRIEEVTHAICASAAEVVKENVDPLILEMAGKDARIDQLETHVKNLETLLYRLAAATGHADMERPS